MCVYIYLYIFYDTLYEHNLVCTPLLPMLTGYLICLSAIVFVFIVVVYPLPLRWRKIASCFQFYYFSYFSTLLFMLLDIWVLLLFLLLLLLLFHFQVHSSLMLFLFLCSYFVYTFAAFSWQRDSQTLCGCVGVLLHRFGAL